MHHFDPSLEDRLSLAAEAKKDLLAKFKKLTDPNSPEAIEKRRERESHRRGAGRAQGATRDRAART